MSFFYRSCSLLDASPSSTQNLLANINAFWRAQVESITRSRLLTFRGMSFSSYVRLYQHTNDIARVYYHSLCLGKYFPPEVNIKSR